MSAALVRADGVGVRYGGSTVLHGLDLEVGAGEQLALSGRSGSGKSTLLLVLAGLLAPTSGAVRWPGLDAEPVARRGQIGMVFQAPSLMPELTAVQNVALSVVSAVELADALPGELSGGQQQRVAVARALAGKHRLVLADEPTGALDRAHAHQVVAALRDAVAASGAGLVIATHDPELVAMFARQIHLSDGDLIPAVAA